MAEDVFYTDEDFNADEKTLWKGYRRILGIKDFFTKYTITNKKNYSRKRSIALYK